MAARTSPLEVKRRAANERERKLHNNRAPLDLGAPSGSRGVAPKRGAYISRGERVRLELAYRARLSPEQREGRAALLGCAHEYARLV